MIDFMIWFLYGYVLCKKNVSKSLVIYLFIKEKMKSVFKLIIDIIGRFFLRY